MKEILKLLCSLSLVAALSASPVGTGGIDVPFKSQIVAADLEISRLHVEQNASELVFTLYYHTETDRTFSFFDPPNGKVLMYIDPQGLKREFTSVTFRIACEKFRQSANITMRFSAPGSGWGDANFIFLTLSKRLRKALDSTDAPGGERVKKKSGANPASVEPPESSPIIVKADEDVRYKTFLNPGAGLGVVRHPPPAALFADRSVLSSLPRYDPDSERIWQVDLRSRDISSLRIADRLSDLMHASFDSRTVWPRELPAGFDPGLVMELGSNPGLGVRTLHRAGITGKGVGIAIIDQGLLVDHVEYSERLRLYEEIHCGDVTAAMHGPAVASIAVGKTTGVAPEADLYYIAETHGVFDGKGGFSWDLSWLARSIDRIVQINAGLPRDKRIRVLSISLGISTALNQGDQALKAIQKAKGNGIYTVYVGSDPFFGLGREPSSNPDAQGSYLPGMILARAFYAGLAPSGIGIPMDCRCTASPTGDRDYAFYSEGGMSWTVPYVAGLFALACQVRPDVTPELFWKTAAKTGQTVEIRKDWSAYRLGKIAAPDKLIMYLRK